MTRSTTARTRALAVSSPNASPGVFALRQRDDGQVHCARQPRPRAVNVGFADVRVEVPLQHHVARVCRVDGWR